MARWNHKTVASALTLSCLALGAVSARGDDEKKQDKPKSEMVKVPLDALEEILKRHPNGSLMKISEFRELLRKAGLTRISDLDAAKAETPPVPYAVSRCDVTGDVSGDQATFEAVATIQVLDSKTVPLYLPLVAVGARDVSVDSRPASLARTGNGYGVLLEGPGERRVVWHFAVPVRKLEERGAGELSVPLFSQAVAGKLTLAIPGDLEITQQGSELPLTVDRDSEKTTLSAAIGGVEAMGLRFAPRVSEAQATPYVTVEDASRFLVRRGFVQLDLTAVFTTYRAGRDRFTVLLPSGFAVRTLEAVARPVAGPGSSARGESAKIEPTWVQHQDKVEIALPRELQGDLGVLVRAELVAPLEGPLELRATSYPGTSRSSGFVGVARGDDVTVSVTGEKSLERADLDELSANRAVSGILRVYRHTSQEGSVALSVKQVEPRVALTVTALEDLREKEIKLLSFYSYRVLEGSVYKITAELPDSFRLEQVQVQDARGALLKPEIREEKKDGKTQELIDLEGGIRAGDEVTVTVHAVRDVPAGIAKEFSKEKPLEVPALSGAPATTTAGYLAFAVDPAYRLRGDVKGLIAVPVEALPAVGLAIPGLSLGFRIDQAGYTGSLLLAKKETRIAAKTLVYHQFDERSIATDALVEFDVTGAPVESLEIVLPEGAGRLARIDGDDVSERVPLDDKGNPAADGKAVAVKGRERWRVGFQSPKSGKVTLYVHFDTQTGAGEADKGKAETDNLDDAPRVSAGEGCERERGTLAVFSSDSTEISAKAENLHPVEITEIEQHPRVRPPGRPLFAYSYAGSAWKLGIQVVRHAPTPVLSAIVERLEVKSSIGRDGTGRHTATFTLKNLSHQFFTLKVPEGARIWSVLVDGEGVKPAEDAGAKIIPLTKASSPDTAVAVTVTYELHGTDLGRFGAGQLQAPALLFGKASEAIPVLKTSWSLSLPDEFRYVEFQGNAQGAVAAVDEPLVVQAWEQDSARMVQVGLFVALALMVFASESARAVLAQAGLTLLTGVVAVGTGARRTVRTRKKLLIGAAGLTVLLFVIAGITSTGGRSFSRHGWAPEAQTELAAADRTLRRSEAAPQSAPANEPRVFLPGAEESDHNESTHGEDYGQLKGDSPDMGRGRVVTAKVGKAANAPAREVEKRKALVDALKKVEKDAKAPAKKTPPAAPPPAAAAPKPAGGAGGAMTFNDEKEGGEDMPKPELGLPAPAETPPTEDGANVLTVTKSFDAEHKSLERERAGKLAEDKPNSPEPLAKDSAFGEKGLRSLVLALPNVGATMSFTREGGDAEIAFRYVRSDVWSGTLVLLAIAGFALGLWLPRRTGVSYLGLFVVAVIALSTLPHLVWPAFTGAPANAFLAGLALVAPVRALLALDRARRNWARTPGSGSGSGSGAWSGSSRALGLLIVAGTFLLAPSTASAQDKPAPAADADRRVFVPYDPEHPDKEQDKVFVPAELYEELWLKAHPESKLAKKPAPPAAYAVSGVSYEGTVSSQGLSLKAQLRVEILQEGWVEAPLGLEGAGLLETKIAPEGAKVQPSARGYALLAKGPATFDLTLDLLVPRSGTTFGMGAIRAGAAVLKLTTPEKGQAIKVLGALGGQVERVNSDGSSDVDASLGAAPKVEIAFGPREVIAHGAGSEASAHSSTVYTVRRGRIDVMSRFTFAISGAGRDGFLFTVPENLEVTSVLTDGLRNWRVKDGLLEVTLRSPASRSAVVLISAERATTTASLELPEISARAVSRDEGEFGVAVEPGLKVKYLESGKDAQGLRQVDQSELAGIANGPNPERAYAFSRRPARIALELLEDALEVKATSRVLGIVRLDRYEVTAEIEFQVKHGRTYELRVVAPADLELEGEPEGVDVREKTVEEVKERSSGDGAPGVKRYAFGLAKALVTPQTAVMKLHFAKRIRQDEKKLWIPDVRALGVSSEDGEVVLCTAEGLRLHGEAEEDRFASTDPDAIARRLKAPQDVKAALGWTRRPKAPSGISGKTAEIQHAKAHVEGTVVTFATVERDVVRTVARIFYDVTEAGAKRFSFSLPARLGERVSVHAPNQRELVSQEVQEEGKEPRRRFEVELQSAVKNAYEMVVEWEELVPPSGQLDLARLDLASVNRSQAFVLVQADPSLTEKLELARARTAAVTSVPAEQTYALPPGKDARDFGDFCYRADMPEWKVGLDLKALIAQAPAPARVDTARITTVIEEDGTVRNKAVYHLRNRTLQFLTVKLPKGASVWTVHVAGEPKRMHQEGENTLVPLPKRADADMGFDVEIVYRTKLATALGLLTKVSPDAPVLATTGVTVERTFWTIHLPSQFEQFSREGNLDEAPEVVGDVQDVKAKVQELAALNDIVLNGKGSVQTSLANDNLEANLAQVEQALAQTEQKCQVLIVQGGQQAVPQTATAVKQVQASNEELNKLRSQLSQIKGQSQSRSLRNKANMEQQQKQQQTVNVQENWSYNKKDVDRSQNWEGLEQGQSAQNAVPQRGIVLQAPANAQGAPDLDKCQLDFEGQLDPNNQKLDNRAPRWEKGSDLQSAGVYVGRKDAGKAANAPRDDDDAVFVPRGGKDDVFEGRRGGTTGGFGYDDQSKSKGKERSDAAEKNYKDSTRDRAQQQDKAAHEPSKPGDAPAQQPRADESVEKLEEGKRIEDSKKDDPSSGEGERYGGRFGGRTSVVRRQQKEELGRKNGPTGGMFDLGIEQAEAKKALLSIGFEFATPEHSNVLHFTTTSTSDDRMQLAFRVVPVSTIDFGGKLARALVVLLLVVAVAKLGLTRNAEGKGAARALALLVAASLAGLAFVNGLFLAVGLAVAILALVFSARGKVLVGSQG